MNKLVLIFIFIITQAAYSQWERCPGWTTTDYEISSMVLSGDKVIIGTDKGVFLSTDNTKSFTAKNNWLTNQNVNILYESGNDIYAGTNSGLFYSSDQGDSWMEIVIGAPSSYINLIAIKGDNIFCAVSSTVYFSSDKGANWAKRDNGLDGNRVLSFAFKNDEIIASTYAGIFVSNDNGENWIGKNNGLLSLYDYKVFVQGDNIFVGAYKSLFLSTDNCESWTEIDNGLPKQGIEYRVNDFAIKENILYASTSRGVYLSSDMGGNWVLSGIGDQDVWELKNDDNGNLYVMTVNYYNKTLINGIYLSTNSGNTWKMIYKINQFGSVNTAFSSGNKIYAGTGTDLYVSEDLGEHWQSLFASSVRSVTVIGDRILAGTAGGGLFVSTDNGDTWDKKTADSVADFSNSYIFSIYPAGTNLIAGTRNKVYLSTDLGDNWKWIGDGLEGLTVSSFTQISGIVYAGTNVGLSKSSDNGITWESIQDGISGNITALASNGNYLFAGLYQTNNTGVWLSTDFGQTWNDKSGSGFVYNNYGNKDVRALTFVADNLFVGLSLTGSFLTRDMGNTWISKNGGIINHDVETYSICGDYIFAGTADGMYRAKINDILPVIDETQLSHNSKIISPNPASDFLNAIDFIGYNYQIIDLLGNILESGSIDSEKMNVSELVPGFYGIVFTKGAEGRVERFIKK